MDLRNNKITIGELLANPKSRQVLARRFPHMVGRPIVAAYLGESLDRVIKMSAAYVPQKFMQETLQELKKL